VRDHRAAEGRAVDAAGEAVEYGTHLYNAARYVFEFQLLMRR
jgi:hypothetical protein